MLTFHLTQSEFWTLFHALREDQKKTDLVEIAWKLEDQFRNQPNDEEDESEEE